MHYNTLKLCSWSIFTAGFSSCIAAVCTALCSISIYIFRVSLASGFCNTVTRETVCQNVLAVAEIGERNNCIKKLFLLSGIVSVIKMSSVILVYSVIIS